MPPHLLRLSGEIAETFERDGHKVTRIALKSGCIEVSLDQLGDAHLGDSVLVDLDINIHRVQLGAESSAAESGTNP